MCECHQRSQSIGLARIRPGELPAEDACCTRHIYNQLPRAIGVALAAAASLELLMLMHMKRMHVITALNPYA